MESFHINIPPKCLKSISQKFLFKSNYLLTNCYFFKAVWKRFCRATKLFTFRIVACSFNINVQFVGYRFRQLTLEFHNSFVTLTLDQVAWTTVLISDYQILSVDHFWFCNIYFYTTVTEGWIDGHSPIEKRGVTKINTAQRIGSVWEGNGFDSLKRADLFFCQCDSHIIFCTQYCIVCF